MNKRKLQSQISKKLTNLEKIIEPIRDIDIQPDDSKTWDPDYYYDLETNLEKALQILRDKKHPKAKDEYGDPIVLENGLLSLLDDYHSEEEESEDDE